jgi:hypothetical protein
MFAETSPTALAAARVTLADVSNREEQVTRAVAEREQGRRRLNATTVTVSLASVAVAGVVAATLPGASHAAVVTIPGTNSSSSGTSDGSSSSSSSGGGFQAPSGGVQSGGGGGGFSSTSGGT